MRKKVSSIITAYLLVFALQTVCHAEVAVPQNIVKSAVMIRGTNGYCGSGVILHDGRILTNAHITQSICPYGKCAGVKIFRAAQIGGQPDEQIDNGSVRLEREVASLDFAILSTAEPSALASDLGKDAVRVKTDEAVYAVGFPHCGALTASEGKVYQVDTLSIRTSTRGTYGSSGSLLLNSSNQLVGILREAASLQQGLLSSALGTHFELSAVPYDPVLQHRALPDAESILYEAKQLNKHYKEELIHRHGLRRLLDGLEYCARTEAIARRAQALRLPGEAIAGFLQIDSELNALTRSTPPAEGNELAQEIEKLTVGYNLESNGLYSEEFQPLNTTTLISEIEASGRPSKLAAELRDLIEGFKAEPYSGVTLTLLVITIIIAAIAFVATIFWTLCGTFVYRRTTGGRVRKIIFTTLINGLLWPLMLLVVLGSIPL